MLEIPEAQKRSEPPFAWARDQIKTWEHAIEYLGSEKMGTYEMRNGQIVDTSDETKANLEKLVAELKELAAEYNGDDA